MPARRRRDVTDRRGAAPEPARRAASASPKASELVADAIRSQIARGEVASGSPLPNETELMREYEVARQTAREALRVLEAEGLIEVQRGAGGGARVRVPDIEAASRHCALLLQLRGATVRGRLRGPLDARADRRAARGGAGAAACRSRARGDHRPRRRR
jgi:DNA-binding FadR family transcriptional regulator